MSSAKSRKTVSLRRVINKALPPNLVPKSMAAIAGVTGQQFVRGTEGYAQASYQYATSTHLVDHHMNPAIIIQPKTKQDIKAAIVYAKTSGIAIAIRTGGHQYSGASSAGGTNIQLDLERTFQGPDDLKILQQPDGSTWVRTGVSRSLGSFNEWLAAQSLFVPHGQCTEVHLGGHFQTGGYGQLARSFGLFGDHVQAIEMIDYNANEITVTKESDPDLFWAISGGSPGNFGVITHLTVKVHKDIDHVGSRGLKALYWYDPNTLQRLLDILVKMSDDPDFPPNYDLCVSVLSSSFKMADLWPELDGQMRITHPEIYGDDEMIGWPRTIIVYAQWCPLKAGDECDWNFFKQFDEEKIWGWVEQKAMSKITGDWIFRNVREFDHPYVKRAYSTKSNNLKGQGWSKWVTGRIDAIVEPLANNCWLSVQIQCYGGNQSRYHMNADNGTSYSFRDTTTVAVLDCFHEAETKTVAEDWQKVNDAEGLGPEGTFSTIDRRLLWGSYGDFNLDAVWDKYYENREKYEKLMAVRKRMDPNGTFSPNPFCVKRADGAEEAEATA